MSDLVFDYGTSASLDEWADKNGWQVLHTDHRGLPDRLIVEFTRKKTPPDININVRDGIGTKDTLR